MHLWWNPILPYTNFWLGLSHLSGCTRRVCDVTQTTVQWVNGWSNQFCALYNFCNFSFLPDITVFLWLAGPFLPALVFLNYYCYWLLLYSTILCSQADSLHSCSMWFWMCDCSLFIAHFEYPPKWCTYSTIWLLHGWCHMNLLPSWPTFCGHHTTMHQRHFTQGHICRCICV